MAGNAEAVKATVISSPREFEGVYRRYSARVYTLACRLAGTAHAEDLTQEVFLRAWERRGSFRGDSDAGTWLHRLAVRWILNRRDALQKRAAETGNDPQRMDAPSHDPGLRVDLETAITALPDRARVVFVLHDVEGWRHQDVAEQLGITAGTSKSQLHRARSLLRAALRPEEGGP